ncbi:F0F1 ATP synthase subunit epsilon [Clostridium felsineum]|uniref:ATP synthase epsilon chain n=1 Tax=Clostridium felsineum TaxID=36839 RepID=A0A1S8KX56_9CLOT|nr:F0F1 ATP synthase subunit epsilon [Clostridium felsineum]MCR3758389.1 F0F1 ATP synthase subunit epsilon [Clostridium felsineum]URZ03750.1 ATP synthase epsilon chain [Clostridium felsineum]URZ07944.1 ATP synthase epsilon chain [Clostridium felsineum]URZ12975.1 ATP synthase epsilon chain [Clostridium felsineum]
MANNIKLSILTPQKTFYVGNVKEIITRTVEGEIGILPNHTDLVAFLTPTETILVEEDGSKKEVFTSTGILNVGAEEVSFLCDASEWPDEIDLNRAETAKERAEKRLKSSKDNIDVKRAELSLSRALARIKTKNS